MSIWGAGPFDNDDAADWLAELNEAPDWETIEEAVSEISDPAHAGYMEIPECCVAVAAAEVLVRVFRRKPRDVLDEDTWSSLDDALEGLPPPRLRQGVEQAIAAVDLVLNEQSESELRQVWQEDDASGFPEWTAQLETTLLHLRAIARELP